MPTGAKPKANDESRDFVVIPSDQVRVAPSDAEITDLLRAAARHHSDVGARAASDTSGALSVPTVDVTFRATAVNDDVPASNKVSLGRWAKRASTGLMLALGIGAAALSWQTFGYAAKKALFTWAPKWAIAASLPLDKLGLGAESAPSDDPAQTAAPPQNASDGGAPANTPDTAQLLQSMARDLANANQEVETLKASIAELKASQQQMVRDLAKVSDRVAEQNPKAKIVAAAPRPAVPMHRPAPTVYSPTPKASSAVPTPAPPSSAYRPASPYPTTQAAAAPVAQPYAPPPISLQPQAEGGLATAPRPPMPVQ